MITLVTSNEEYREIGQRVVVDGAMGRVTRMGFQGGPDTYNQVATIVLDGDFSYEDRCRIVKEQRKL